MALNDLLTYHDVDSVDNRDPALVAAAVAVLEPLLGSYFHPVIRGFDNLPPGGALLVGNHSGGLLAADSFLLAIAIWRNVGPAAMPYPLTHEVVIRLPVFNQLLAPLGAVRASWANAARLLQAGYNVLVYPGGDEEACRRFSARDTIDFGHRRGYMRLALTLGVPLVPVVTAGAHETLIVLRDGRTLAHWLLLDRLHIHALPVALCLPWGVMFGPLPYWPLPTRIYTQIMPPVTFGRYGAQAAADDDYVEACHAHLLAQMRPQLDALVAERRASSIVSSLYHLAADRLWPPQHKQGDA